MTDCNNRIGQRLVESTEWMFSGAESFISIRRILADNISQLLFPFKWHTDASVRSVRSATLQRLYNYTTCKLKFSTAVEARHVGESGDVFG